MIWRNIFWWERISRFSTVCSVEITGILTHIWQQFRESNGFTKYVNYYRDGLTWRNIFWWERVNVSYFHTVFSLTHFWQKFRETNILTKEVTKELISRNIFSVRDNFLFHTCDIVASAQCSVKKNERFIIMNSISSN